MLIENLDLWWVFVASVVMFFLTLVVVPLVVIALPSDYFSQAERRKLFLRSTHPALALIVRAGKNLLGVAFIVLGIAMLILPGQGILTILIGLSLVNFPGKYRLEQRLARLRSVRRAIDWVRAKANKPPLIFE